MPRFDFTCCQCGRTLERRVSGAPDSVRCVFCGDEAKRQFPTGVMVAIPRHFKMTRREQLEMVSPAKDDHEGWDARQNPSQSHAPKQQTLQDHLDETVFKRERIEVR